jgi:hypothetical protein
MESTPEAITSHMHALRTRADLSMSALAKAMGRSAPSSVQRYFDPKQYGGGYLKRDFVAELAKVLVGKGKPPIRREEVWALAGPEFEAKARNFLVGSFDPDAAEGEAEGEGASIGTETGIRGLPTDASPQLDLVGGLGAGGISVINEGVPGRHGMTFAADQIRDYWRLPPPILVALGLAARDIAIIPVQGDSMYPTLNEGDVVFIDTRHRWPSPPGLYALLDELGGVVVKRLEVSSPPGAERQTINVISDNTRHTMKVWPAEDVHIIGRVLRKFGTIG